MRHLPESVLVDEIYLYEGLTYTYDAGKVIRNMNGTDEGLLFFQFGDTTDSVKENRIGLRVASSVSDDIISYVLVKMNNFGWFASYFYAVGNVSKKHKFEDKAKFIEFVRSTNRTVIVFDAKYDREVGTRNAKFLYHVTSSAKRDKILSIGLAPKSQSKAATHPNRIYLTFEVEQAETLLYDSRFYPAEKNFVVFRVIWRSLRNGDISSFLRTPLTSIREYTLMRTYPPITSQFTRSYKGRKPHTYTQKGRKWTDKITLIGLYLAYR
jgi:hypothetical protein